MTIEELEAILAKCPNKQAKVRFSQMGIDEQVYSHTVYVSEVILELTFEGQNWDEYHTENFS